MLESSFTDSSQNPNTCQAVQFIDELIDLAVGGVDLALKAGILFEVVRGWFKQRLLFPTQKTDALTEQKRFASLFPSSSRFSHRLGDAPRVR